MDKYIEVIHKYYDALMRGDWPLLERCVSEHAIFTNHKGDRVGKHESLQQRKILAMPPENLKYEIRETFDLGDGAIISVDLSFDFTAEGYPLTQNYVITFGVALEGDNRPRIIVSHLSVQTDTRQAADISRQFFQTYHEGKEIKHGDLVPLRLIPSGTTMIKGKITSISGKGEVRNINVQSSRFELWTRTTPEQAKALKVGDTVFGLGEMVNIRGRTAFQVEEFTKIIDG